MSWKFWKKDTPKEDVVVQAVPYSTLYRWFCYDVGVTDLNKLDEQVGLVPISDELKEMEHRESEKRLDTIESLIPFIDGMSEISSMVYVQTQLKELVTMTNPELDEENIDKLLEAMGMLHKISAFASILGAFSSAASIGIINVMHTEITEVVGEPHEH